MGTKSDDRGAGPEKEGVTEGVNQAGNRAGTAWAPVVRRSLPLAVLLAGLVLFFALGLDRYLSFEELSRHREWLTRQVQAHGIVAALAFIGVYALVTATSVPGGAVLTVLGGFLFGIGWGTLYAVVGATLGAVAIFLAARTALGEPLRRRAGPAVRRMAAGFHEHALSYLLVLRLVPLFPFWLVNLVPAFLGVPLRIYLIGTFFGIIPGTFVYASVGNGLGRLIAAGERPDLGIIFEPAILTPILGLAVLALIPVVYRKLRARRGDPPA